jgi:hypothetical protein
MASGSGEISITSIYKILASAISKYEKSLYKAISSISNTSGTNINQGQLLNLQAQVQTWGTMVSTSTGVVRGIGDTLTKITQNVR